MNNAKILIFIVMMAAALAACQQTTQQATEFLSNPQQRNDTRHATDNQLLQQQVKHGVPEIMLQRKRYVTSYNKERRTPNWVAWTLTKSQTYGKLRRDNERFEEDTDVPQPRATFQDYYNSRMDRGHMCPAGDNKWDQQAMTQSFLLTNICPQDHALNTNDWNDLEMQCRTWARQYGQVTIVCGPIFTGNTRTIGRNKVAVPSHFFKVVYRENPSPKAIAFIFQNNGKSQPWQQQACSVDHVEDITGIDFFCQLPDQQETRLEAENDLKNW